MLGPDDETLQWGGWGWLGWLGFAGVVGLCWGRWGLLGSLGFAGDASGAAAYARTRNWVAFGQPFRVRAYAAGLGAVLAGFPLAL